MPTLLEKLMARAIRDQREEPAFFQALLKVTLYAHIPLTDRIDAGTDRIRFVQFHRPDNGQLVLPFFTDVEKARVAAGSTVQVIALEGRHFLQLTQGATLMMDPNDTSCLLYPEEVEALLQTGRIASIQKFVVQEKAEPLVGPLEDIPEWLASGLMAALAKLPFVQTAYLAGVYRNVEPLEHIGYLIAVGGDPRHAERTSHAVATALQVMCETSSKLPIDLTHFDINEEAPSWVTNLALQPIYDRDWADRLHHTAGST